jgi:hypothetical protein
VDLVLGDVAADAVKRVADNLAKRYRDRASSALPLDVTQEESTTKFAEEARTLCPAASVSTRLSTQQRGDLRRRHPGNTLSQAQLIRTCRPRVFVGDSCAHPTL